MGQPKGYGRFSQGLGLGVFLFMLMASGIALGTQAVKWKVLCKQLDYGAAGPQIPIHCERKSDQGYEAILGSEQKSLDPEEEYQENLQGEDPVYQLRCNANFQWWYNRTLKSNDLLHTRILTNGAALPAKQVPGQALEVPACLADYVDSHSSQIKLQPCQALVFFEFSDNLQELPEAAYPDYTDLVLLLTVGRCDAKNN